ncbi:type III secretion inner membrane ring lipoprotein SctJ [Escherichia fergusonii]|nr:EscJ/YscJ/HrcJ family type III secretion inner membrane ring protein [Escherichia fergusonii]EHJ4135592.1 EscJ/YscJ/HrcJ family type III secretion inner membrane ring protein [Escherichia fergusonii]
MFKHKGLFLLPMLMLGGCEQREELVNNLSQNQANEIISVLERHNISAKKVDVGKQGIAVQVEKGAFASSVDLMRMYHLPNSERVDISQMFPVDSLVSSPRAEKARLYSAIEQRLEQSLVSIGGVISAKVHVSYDLDDKNGSSKPMHVSVIAIYDSPKDSELLVSNIKRFLKNTFSEVKYENISVILTPKEEYVYTNVQPVKEVKSSFYNEFWYLFLAALPLLILAGIWIFRVFGSKKK